MKRWILGVRWGLGLVVGALLILVPMAQTWSYQHELVARLDRIEGEMTSCQSFQRQLSRHDMILEGVTITLLYYGLVPPWWGGER